MVRFPTPFIAKNVCPCWDPDFSMAVKRMYIGTTSNPHSELRTCGGSSGGEAALIAAGGSICGLGSDMGGSIRVPAAFSGCCGFKVRALFLLM